jgi:hypothetical protein
MVGIKAVFALSLSTCALTVLIASISPFCRLDDHAADKKDNGDLERSV